MKNKEMKKNAPKELNNEELEMVAGGTEVISTLPQTVTIRSEIANGGESCSLCKKAIGKGNVFYLYEKGLLHAKLCEQCNFMGMTNGHQFSSEIEELEKELESKIRNKN